MIDTKAKSKDRAVGRFMQALAERNPHEAEFLQAVREVAEVIIPFTYEHSDYHKADILQKTDVIMIEGAANELPEAEFIKALHFAQSEVTKIVAAQEELTKLAGKPNA